MPPQKNTPENVAEWLKLRNYARASLLYLCVEVLGYRDVSKAVHGEVLKNLQGFGKTRDLVQVCGACKGKKLLPPNPSDYAPPEQKVERPCLACDEDGLLPVVDPLKFNARKLIKSYWCQKPMWELWANTGSRSNLIMIPRGHLKSTIITQAHAIQWILNYPNVRILISSGTGERAIDFVRAIKEHFQTNETLRQLFPEYVPQGKNVKDWGTREGFTTPARTATGIKEPTVSICAIGSFIAGGHFDVIINDDLVDKENCKTPEGIANVKSHFGLMGPLLERRDKRYDWEQRKWSKHPKTGEPLPWIYNGWRYLVGTIYNFSDLHYSIIAEERKKLEQGKPTEWNLCVISAAPNYPEGPTLWPSRFPIEELRRIENDPAEGPDVLYPQYLMNPRPGKSGLVDKRDDLKWVPAAKRSEIEPRLRLRVTIDLADMNPTQRKGGDTDYCVVNLTGFGPDGNLYLSSVLHTRQITPQQLIAYLFAIYDRYPRIISFKAQKDHFARTVEPFLKPEQFRRNKFLPFTLLPIDNSQAKKQKLKGLQPFFGSHTIQAFEDFHVQAATLLHRCLGHVGSVHSCGEMCCIEAMAAKTFYEDEVLFFPKYDHDDILDTVYDAMMDSEGKVGADVLPSVAAAQGSGYVETGWGVSGRQLPSGDIQWQQAFPEKVAYVLQRAEEMQQAEREWDEL